MTVNVRNYPRKSTNLSVGIQGAIQWQDEGINTGTPGGVDVVNLTGVGISASESHGVLTVTASGVIADGDYGDVRVSGGGTVMAIESVSAATIVYVPPGSGLQAAINAFSAGGTIYLGAGTYTGDITIADTHSSLVIHGAGRDNTVLSGSLTIEGNQISIDNVWVKATGKAFGIKVYKNGAGPNRNHLTLVRAGGTTNSSDGPTGPGLWLDGGILNVFDHCLFAFNGGDGVYVNTTDVTGHWTTNCNSFRDCTINLNDGHGVKAEVGVDGTAGMSLLKFDGGNMENNALGEVYAESVFLLELMNIDFESAVNLGDTPTIEVSGGTVVIHNCEANAESSGTKRFFVISSAIADVQFCRPTGYANMDVGVFDEGCVQIHSHGSSLWDPAGWNGDNDVIGQRWYNNRGSMWGYNA